MLEPGHAGEDRKFASVRRYTMRTGELSELLHIVDDVFADQIERWTASTPTTHSTAVLRE